MMFNFGGKKTVATPPKGQVATKAAPKPTAKAAPKGKVGSSVFKNNEGSANKGSYVPEGLSAEQYSKFLAAESAKKDKAAKRFPLGKEVETLTEWMDKEAKLGFTGKDLLKRHRLVKAKYEEFYTDESPV